MYEERGEGQLGVTREKVGIKRSYDEEKEGKGERQEK